MSESVLFIIVGLIAIAAAIAMLLSEDAIHSALFLVINFGCVAFLYVMLEAPFLAMVQIAVYAGAIMVLFLFVIMLLGAEKLTAPTRQFRWLGPLAIGLAAAFLIITGISITQGQIDVGGTSTPETLLRVVHAAPYTGPVDVYADNELIASNVAFGEATDFQTVAPGEHSVALTAPGTTNAVALSTVMLEADAEKEVNAYTAVAYGGDQATLPQISVLTDDLNSTDPRTGRVIVFNAYNEPLSLVDYGSPFDAAETDPTKKDDIVILADIAPALAIELKPQPETQSLLNWGFSAGNDVFVRLDNPEVYKIERDTSQILIVGEELTSSGEVRSVVVPVVTQTVSSFGSPQAVGKLLFSKFILPFQLIAVLLLAAMIGAIVLTHKEDFVPRRRDVRRRVMKPLAAAVSDQIGRDVSQPADDMPLPALPEQQAEAAGD